MRAKQQPLPPLTRLWADRRGQSATLQFLIVVLVLVLVLGLAMFLTKIRPAQVSVAAAARACASQSGVSLSQQRNLHQGTTAAHAVLQAAHLDPGQAVVTVTPLGPWGRFGQVSCQVDYTVDLRAVPYLRAFAPGSQVTLHEQYTVSVNPHKSRWEP